MTDRELLQLCKQFLEDMHVLDAVETVAESQVLHARVSQQLATTPAPAAPSEVCQQCGATWQPHVCR